MNNATIKRYCKEWSGGWVVAGLRRATKEELDQFQQDWPVLDKLPELDEECLAHIEYLDRRMAAWFRHRNVALNLSSDFATEEEARTWMIECAENGATILFLMDPDTFEWTMDSMDSDNNFKPMAMRIVAEHIQWLMKEDA